MPWYPMDWIKFLWNNNPLKLILWVALILRLVAVIFSRGYGMHDDHFLVIETAQSWLDGASYNNWFLERENTDSPTILNFFYAGLHYILFFILGKGGITDPQIKMYIVRLVHALWSLLVVYYGYKITEKLADQRTARITGLLLATLWLMPFFSVRNLVEMACIPFLMAGFWQLLNAQGDKGHLMKYLYASLLFGMAFTFRIQTLIFPAGIGLVLLYRKKILECLILAGGIIIILLLTHGLSDWIIWGRPFTALGEYLTHNIDHRFDYTVGPWYIYILVIIGVLIPPLSLILLTGFFRSWKKYAIIFIPTLLFLIFHSYYPNKQERFILPALPFILMLGMIGWNNMLKHPVWLKYIRIIAISWIFFWIVNTALLALFTTMYTKKARVEAMTYLSRYDDIEVLVSEDIHRPHASMLPLYYLQQWPVVLTVTEEKPLSDLKNFLSDNPSKSPSFVLFFGGDNLITRVQAMQQFIPGLVPEKVIHPSWPDRLLHWLNPVNANQDIYIYRNEILTPGYY
jgi:4-amino-4-deoxy-L-arabinose transferase-like glycosyltransferase